MSTVTFQLDDQKAGQLAKAAQDKGIHIEELLQQITDDFLSRSPRPSADKAGSDDAFKKALADSVSENEELLRRLAK